MLSMPTQYLVDEDGEKMAVVLAIDIYQQLLEELHDLRVIAQRREEQPISLTEMMTRLQVTDEQL